jgi:hypothetical protein
MVATILGAGAFAAAASDISNILTAVCGQP